MDIIENSKPSAIVGRKWVNSSPTLLWLLI